MTIKCVGAIVCEITIPNGATIPVGDTVTIDDIGHTVKRVYWEKCNIRNSWMPTLVLE